MALSRSRKAEDVHILEFSNSRLWERNPINAHKEVCAEMLIVVLALTKLKIASMSISRRLVSYGVLIRWIAI